MDEFGSGMMIGGLIAAVISGLLFILFSNVQHANWEKEAVEHNAAVWIPEGEPPHVEYKFEWVDNLEEYKIECGCK
jgi:hypothetical protein